ncbi:hypothetical protein [Vannielia sp. SX4]|uniref:hypothetical protein n=1 Tax=Vannielia sp. SX4 TaxID=3463852 RepID=UPI0040594996
MEDWRKNLTPEEARELEVEDAHLRRRDAVFRKRAKDAFRMACKRAGPAMPVWLSAGQKESMLELYLVAQHLEAVRSGKWQVDHIVPLHGTCPETGNFYICGLHVPSNLRVIAAEHNRSRSHNLPTFDQSGFDSKDILNQSDDEIPF